eukprot:scaffold116081_cov30-Tisochrysis_lutea.AAC.5
MGTRSVRTRTPPGLYGPTSQDKRVRISAVVVAALSEEDTGTVWIGSPELVSLITSPAVQPTQHGPVPHCMYSTSAPSRSHCSIPMGEVSVVSWVSGTGCKTPSRDLIAGVFGVSGVREDGPDDGITKR